MEGFHIIGATFACISCQFDPDIPKDDPNTTILTVFEGNMFCLYHFPKRLEEWIQLQKDKRRR